MTLDYKRVSIGITNQIKPTPIMSDVKKTADIASKLIAELQGVTDELAIKKATLKYWQEMKKAVSEGNYTRCRTTFRKAILAAFSNNQTATPGYYFTNAGKGNIERFEHLALWYATTEETRWNVTGEDARKQYFGSLPELPKTEVTESNATVEIPVVEAIEQTESIKFDNIPGFEFTKVLGKVDGNCYWQGIHQSGLKTQKHKEIEHAKKAALSYFSTKLKDWNPEETEPTNTVQETAKTTQPTTQLTLESMNIETLQLPADTQEMVQNALTHSGLSLPQFIQKACTIYATTLTGKAKQFDSDLSAVLTEELLTSAKYKTHPVRAEELAKRAIVALENHNNNCTEKSQKWHINQTAIQSLIGSKPATVKAILQNYTTRLDDHNSKHDLSPYDNRKKGKTIQDDIDLVALVPDGIDL